MTETSRVIGDEGFWIIKDNPITRTGVFEYSLKEMGLPAPDGDRLCKVYRPPEALNNPETIESFKLKPIIDDHALLGRDGVPADEKGVAGAIGETVYYAVTDKLPEGGLFANLSIFSEDLQDQINSGKKELSCGFLSRYTYAPGIHNGETYEYIQNDITGNHLAVVNEGRMGSAVAVLDAVAPELTKRETENKMEDVQNLNVPEIRALLTRLHELLMPASGTDEVPDTSTEAVTPAVTGDDVTDAPVQAAETVAAETETTGAADDTTDMDTESGPVATEDAVAAVYRDLALRSELVDSFEPIVGKLAVGTMDSAALANHLVKKTGIKAPRGQEIAALRGYAAAYRRLGGSTAVTSMDGRIAQVSARINTNLLNKFGVSA